MNELDKLRQQVKRLKREKALLINASIPMACPPDKAECDRYQNCKACLSAWLRRKMKEGK